MRELETSGTASVVIQERAFIQDLRRDHFELGIRTRPSSTSRRHSRWRAPSSAAPQGPTPRRGIYNPIPGGSIVVVDAAGGAVSVAIAATGAVGISTMKVVAAAGLVSHYLRTLDGTAGLDNPWFCVVEQLRPWHSPVPIDPGIASDSRRLQELARSARYSPDTSPVGSLAAAATATAAAVDDLVDLATRLMPSVDRWVPAKPSPSYLVRPNAVPYIAWRPTEAPIPWPTNAASIAPPAV